MRFQLAPERSELGARELLGLVAQPRSRVAQAVASMQAMAIDRKNRGVKNQKEMEFPVERRERGLAELRDLHVSPRLQE